MKQRYADKGFEVVAVNLDKDRKLADEFLKVMDVNFVLAFDEDGVSASSYKTTTLGLKYGYALGSNSELSVRGEFMTQTFDDGDVPSIEETPDLDAVILNIGYSVVW